MPGQNECLLYKEALQRLTINMDVDEPLLKEWIVRVDREASSYSLIQTTVKSMSMTRSMVAKTKNLMRGQYTTKNTLRIINQGDVTSQQQSNQAIKTM